MSDELNARLRTIVGAANVLEAEADMAPFLSDWRGRYHGAARAVVRPHDTAELAAVVGTCAAAGEKYTMRFAPTVSRNQCVGQQTCSST